MAKFNAEALLLPQAVFFQNSLLSVLRAVEG
jgi:hypothetical protein